MTVDNPDPADVPFLCPECGHPYSSQLAANACCRDDD